ncbi:MAG: sulfurtransferase, partial [Micrococcaceae bacterium]|nr:sulfurtransferase [Micrococcaceae bacterium]
MDVLITTEALAARIAAGQRTVILDVRWALGSTTGEEDHLAGHIPGAVYVDLETELAAPARPQA